MFFFFETKKVKPLNESLNSCFFIAGAMDLILSSLNNNLDLYNVYGVKKEDKNKLKKNIIIEINNNKFTKEILFIPEDHKITNSLSFICLLIKIVKDKRNEKGINLVAIAKRFKKEY